MTAFASIFTEEKKFRIFYFFLLSLHLIVNYLAPNVYFLYITKQLFLSALIIYFFVNSKFRNSKPFKIMLLGLSSFWLGDLSLSFFNNKILLNLGILFFIVGKLFYCIRFSNNKEFKFSKIMPYVTICFFYMVFLMTFLLDHLENQFFSVLIYLFITITVGLFAFLRQYEVNRISFLVVFIGVLFSFISDSVSIINTFYNDIYVTKYSVVVIFYSFSQYLIVNGVLIEKIEKKDN